MDNNFRAPAGRDARVPLHVGDTTAENAAHWILVAANMGIDMWTGDAFQSSGSDQVGVYTYQADLSDFWKKVS